MSRGEVFPEQYEAQLAAKEARLTELLLPFDAPRIETFASPPAHYRMRAEFRIWHDGDDLHYVMFEPGDNRTPIRITSCPMVSETIHKTMFELLAAIQEQPTLSRRLFQIDFLSTLSGELLVTLIYHRKLDDSWLAAARPMEALFGIKLIGRSRGKKLVLSEDFVIETLAVDDDTLRYQQVENGFTQPNAIISQSMLSWSRSVTANAGGDLLELYCGNGNFSVALAGNFDRVLATEVSKTSVRAAIYNCEINQVNNLAFARISSEEFVEAMNKVRAFRRLKDIDLESYAFSTILVDPPRAGLDPATEALVGQFERIVYISCNPQTLQSNLQVLSKTHRIERAALFDQFPYTDHMESGVCLVRKALA